MKYSLGLKEEKTRKAKFSWGFVDWEPCNAICGPGERISKARCLEEIGGIVDDIYCKNFSKPEVKVSPCDQSPCLPRWMIGDWQGCEHCTGACKRVRAVKCVRPVGHGEQDIDIIPDNYCQGPKPLESMSCQSRRRRTNENSAKGPSNHGHDELNNVGKLKTGQLVIDKDYIENLTLTIIVERDENGNVVNFPKDFLPKLRENDTEFILNGTDAVKYIQSIQQEEKVTSSLSPM